MAPRMDQNPDIVIPEASRNIDGLLYQLYRGSTIYLPKSGPMGSGHPVPKYSSSIDAAISLLETELPGFGMSLIRSLSGTSVLVSQSHDIEEAEAVLDMLKSRHPQLTELPDYDSSTISTKVDHEKAASAICTALVMISMSITLGRKLTDFSRVMEAFEAVASDKNGITRTSDVVNKMEAYTLFMDMLSQTDPVADEG